ncbi:MAG: helix-turn-helix domain-containing protein [Exilibacterium sp.]
MLRSLVEKIVLTPKPGPEGLRIDLYGNLAGILRVATEDDALLQQSHMLIEQVRMITTDRDDHSNPSVKVVAGAADEIVNLRKRLNMSRRVFAAMLRTSPRTLERWEQDKGKPDQGSATLLKLVEAHPETLEMIASL